MTSPSPPPAGPESGESDRRLAEELALGLCRAFAEAGQGALTEFTLANGRRADLMAIDGKGRVTIVEIKSSRQDFQADQKWRDYLEFCDSFFFAVAAEFPIELLPPDVGVIVADRYGAHWLRPSAPLPPLAAARRKALLLRFAMLASGRLLHRIDPPL
jgi:hypothetical protein